MWLQLSSLFQATEEVDMMRLADEGFTMSHQDVLPSTLEPSSEIRRLSKISCYWTKEVDFCSHIDFSTEFVEDVLTILEKLVFSMIVLRENALRVSVNHEHRICANMIWPQLAKIAPKLTALEWRLLV